MDFADHYADQGYVVFERLIPAGKIDAVLSALERFKRARLPYYSQSIHTWIRPEIDAHGFMRESMENFSCLFLDRGLSRAGNAVLLGGEILGGLRSLHPRLENFVQWQNMLFDRSTGTLEHYDSWYLDTLPEGFLTAAWVALEDIEPDAGPFRVYPGSHKHFADNPLDALPHEEFARKCAQYAASHPHKAALLRKGDVLFWHPALLHGALDQANEQRSRKSLTSHYYPLGFSRKGDDAALLEDSAGRRLRGLLRYPVRHAGHPIFSIKNGFNTFMFNSLGLLSFARNCLSGRTKVHTDMRRSSYE
jgi:phytanoyl-CoA hydroxylase